MGNDASTQAGLLAAKAKMSGALSSVEETLNLKHNDNPRTESKPREWTQMHQETAEVWVGVWFLDMKGCNLKSLLLL